MIGRNKVARSAAGSRYGRPHGRFVGHLVGVLPFERRPTHAYGGIAKTHAAGLRAQRREVQLGRARRIPDQRDVAGIEPAAGHHAKTAPCGLHCRADRHHALDRGVSLPARENAVHAAADERLHGCGTSRVMSKARWQVTERGRAASTSARMRASSISPSAVRQPTTTPATPSRAAPRRPPASRRTRSRCRGSRRRAVGR